MSRFFHEDFSGLEPYTPGEQPKNPGLIKLNTNESPFPPSPKVVAAITETEVRKLNLYPDPESMELISAASACFGLPERNIIAGNGSDELLAFSFMAFQKGGNVFFPDISYGFYEVYANVYGANPVKIPLKENLDINIEEYFESKGLVVIANPNAQTGTALKRIEIEDLLRANRESLILVDEAYVDFGGESSVELVSEYDNLLVIQTLSKSRNLAGGRVGLAFAEEEIIKDLSKMKYSFNPYNLNRLSILAAAAALNDKEYFENCMKKIIDTREEFVGKMKNLGFLVIPSMANFVLIRHDKVSGEDFYNALRERNILVRHFRNTRIADYVRITIGKKEDMDALVAVAKEVIT